MSTTSHPGCAFLAVVESHGDGTSSISREWAEPGFMSGPDTSEPRGLCRAAVAMWTAGRCFVGVLVIVASVCLGLVWVSGASAASPPAPIPTCTSSIPNCTPPELLNDGELTTQFALDPNDFYAATPDQVASLHAFERQAIHNTLADYHLPSSDAEAVESWGRPQALAELFGLVVQAIRASNPTPDQQNVVAWLTTVIHRRARTEADHAGWEFLRWAGLLPGNRPIPSESTLVDMLNRVDAGSPQPTQYDTGNNQTATSGFCEWQPPAPFQGEYTGDWFTPGAQSTADTWCFPPSFRCTSLLGCNNNQPSYDQFVKYGDADVENARRDSTDSAVLSTQVARALEFGGAAVGAGIAGLTLAGTLGPVLTGSALTTAIFPYTSAALLDYGVATQLISDEIAGAVAASAVGSVATIVIAAVAIAVIEGIQVVNAAKVPGQLSSLITNAASGTPDLQAMLGDPQQLAGLLGVFTGAALPNPSPDTCDNSSLIVNGAGITPVPCLNAPPIPPPAPNDPQFLITPKGSNQGSLSDTISWTEFDPAVQQIASNPGGDFVETQDTARLSGHWFVTHVTDATGRPTPKVTTTPDVQSLSIHYVDWNSVSRTAWLVPQVDGGYVWLSAADGVQINPATCVADHTCALSDSIDYIRYDSLTAPTPTFHAYSATVVPAQRPDITIDQLSFRGRVIEGFPTTFSARVSGGVGPFTEQWYFQTATSWQHICLTPSSVCGYDGPFNASQVVYTPQAGGSFRGVLLVTDGGGRTYEQDFTVNVADVPPVLTVGKTDVHTVEFGTSTTLTGVVNHNGSDDAETVTTDWGDGSSTSFTVQPGVISFPSPEMTFTVPSGTEIDFSGQHLYATTGTYPVTVTVTDGDGGSATRTSTETVNPQVTTTSLAASTTTPVVGQPVTYTATVSTGGARPTNTVSFTDGSTVVCADVALSASAPYTATCTQTYDAPGTHTVTAAYSGDGDTTASAASGVAVSVGKAGTSTGLTVSAAAAVVGQSVTYTATVAVAAPGHASPTGTVSFADGSTVVCADVALSATAPYTATCTQTYDAPGTHTVTAAYSGDGDTTASAASGVAVSVGKAGTSTGLTVSAAAAVVGQSVTYTATVAVAAPGHASPTGTVSFTDGATVVCADVPVSATAPYTATCTQTYQAPGAHTVTAAYSGDPDTTASASSGAAFTAYQRPSSVVVFPAPGGIYSVGQSVATRFTCAEGANGPGLSSCTDSHGASAPAGRLDTSTPGTFTYTVTATSKDGLSTTESVRYTVAAAPSASISAPADGASYTKGQVVDAGYDCREGAGGPGIASCAGTLVGGQPIDTSTPGRHAFTVTATSWDGQIGATTVSYTVLPPSNQFAVAHIHLHRDGTITFTVALPGPGAIDVLETAWDDNLAHAAALLQPATHRFVYARKHVEATDPGVIRIRVRPNRRGKRLVHHYTYRVVLRLWVTYTPAGGTSHSISFYGLHLPR